MEEKDRSALNATLGKALNRQLLYYLDICARCAICRDACHQYVETKDVRYLPAYRAELIRRVYKKNFNQIGKFFPSLYEGREIDDQWLDELYNVTYACTGCRRCMVFCPFSIDTTQVLAVAKTLLNAAGKGPQMLVELSDASIAKGENIHVFKDVMMRVFKDIEKEVQDKVNDPSASIPVDKEGADVLYVALAGPHTILPAAIIFHQANEDWTLSMFEASNYGYFLGDVKRAKAIVKRIVDEAKRLKVKEVVITECGHAYRVMKFFQQGWAGEKPPFKVSNILELIARYIEEGRIRVDAGRIKEPVTYHDPCQIGRNGGIFEEPRYILRQVAADFREMTPNREKNWCCGGGGGLVAEPDFEEFRIRTGRLKAEQVKKTQAKIVVTPCENCRLQFGGLDEKYDLGVKVSSVMDLVVDAMAA